MMKSKAKGSSPGKLGHILMKDKKKSKRVTRTTDGSWLHSSELEDGYEWGRLNLRSVTEESQLDEFLNTAQLAGTEFTAEKLNIKVVDKIDYTGLPSMEERETSKKAEEENSQYLSIPRRPKWDSSTTSEQLELRERESFLEWRRSLVTLQEDERLTMTPFERNIGFWRQLWRVVERSDIVMQIVDARNPLLFRCEDLERYVLEIDPKKVNVVLMSKADLLTPRQRHKWAEYFHKNADVVVAFWSAILEEERLKNMNTEPDSSSIPDLESESTQEDCVPATTESAQGDRVPATTESAQGDRVPATTETAQGVPATAEFAAQGDRVPATTESAQGDRATESAQGDRVPATTESDQSNEATPTKTSCYGNRPDILNGEELIELLIALSPVPAGTLTTVGMVGYPNVGKSSTINALFQEKKVPVSATPGRTKHFQTLFLNPSLMLCDCPGLVFPTFISSKAEMVCCGILPIDQLREHTPPVALVAQRMPRPILEGMYGIKIPPPKEGEESDRVPYPHELLSAYGYMRGFMTSHGVPDEPRSARYILKDYVNGKLLYCHPPPGEDEQDFNFPTLPVEISTNQNSLLVPKVPKTSDTSSKHSFGEFDSQYFCQVHVEAIVKGHGGVMKSGNKTPGDQDSSKPWKKHHNGHKKEKTRRTQN